MRRLGVLVCLGLVSGLALSACGARPAGQKYVVFFTEWSASLDDGGQSAVSAAAKWAKEHPGQGVVVSGYADPEGSQQANVDLSRTRAQVVYDQLVTDGIDASRIRREAHGPVDFTLTSQESRRVEIQLAGS